MKIIKRKKETFSDFLLVYFAERGGFEPPKRFRRLHAFQACLFNHSSIFPLKGGAKVVLFF